MTEEQLMGLLRNLEVCVSSFGSFVKILSEIKATRRQSAPVSIQSTAMSAQKKITLNEERREIYTLYREGWSLARIEQKYGYKKATIRRKLTNYESEIGLTDNAAYQLTEEDREIVKRIARETLDEHPILKRT